MILSIGLVAIGIFFSAFFSGSETGFYRVTRVRLVMDAKSGKLVSRCLLWLVSFPSVVVATVLIGNNIANYLVSFGLLLASKHLFANSSGDLQTLVPVLATPVLFIYGELLPKYLYYNAPYFLSTRGAPLMVLCALLFMPISILVIAYESLSQKLFGSRSVRSRFSLERQELQRVLLEGQEAGLLLPVQREMAQNLFTYGVRPVRYFTIPIRAIPVVQEGADAEEMLSSARRFKQRFIGVLSQAKSQLVGCYLVADLLIAQPQAPAQMCTISQVNANQSSIQTLIEMQRRQTPVALVVDDRKAAIGVITQDRLVELLLPES